MLSFFKLLKIKWSLKRKWISDLNAHYANQWIAVLNIAVMYSIEFSFIILTSGIHVNVMIVRVVGRISLMMSSNKKI